MRRDQAQAPADERGDRARAPQARRDRSRPDARDGDVAAGDRPPRSRARFPAEPRQASPDPALTRALAGLNSLRVYAAAPDPRAPSRRRARAAATGSRRSAWA